MAYLDPIGIDHIIYRGLLEQLKAYSNEARAADPMTGFFVSGDFVRMLESNKFPYVTVYHPDGDPQQSKSSGQGKHAVYTGMFRADMVTTRMDTIRTDQDIDLAVDRLIYLKQQVMNAFFRLSSQNFGIAELKGQIGVKKYPRFQALIPENQMVESPVVGYRMDFEIDYPYYPPGYELQNLESIRVTGNMFSAYYDSLQGD